MRELTKQGKSFGFSFMSYSRERQASGGVVEVRHATLRKRGNVEFNSMAEIMEEYTDIDTQEQKHFYHPTLMTFNGQSLNLE